jgi:hypothetical protein
MVASTVHIAKNTKYFLLGKLGDAIQELYLNIFFWLDQYGGVYSGSLSGVAAKQANRLSDASKR